MFPISRSAPRGVQVAQVSDAIVAGAEIASTSGRGALEAAAPEIEDNFAVANSDDDLRKILTKAAGRLVVVNFGSAWCKKCESMAGPFVSLSLEHPEPVFVSADVDDLPQYSAKIRYLPTFSFFSTRGQKVDEVTGTNLQSVQDHLWLHTTEGR